ncbi:hypothetical protein [Halobacterium litoreum]|uniref:Glyoxylase, beta-lactamase superfamily II n=1 Tax=Halobacterium litoreum TaxID=2039234 RepID=A0ABD5NBJ6_9EURY|nr:hypothetical protein [Halobacterium litoreum]UHH14740.1 hypothetical protein LT972_06985 [Halobacterium litoreum]
MPMKAGGRATDFEVIDRFDGGVGWIAHSDETMQRASHALVVQNEDENEPADVWVIDPVDADGLDDFLADLGDVRGAVVLMDRHSRDSEAIARRHDVPVYVPDSVDLDFGTRTERVGGALPGTDYEVVQTVDWPGWDEVALYDGETLVVGDVVGTADYFTTGRERIGVHPMLRVKPPGVLRKFSPERILTGHGRGVMNDGDDALRHAVDGARKRGPKLWLESLKSLVS